MTSNDKLKAAFDRAFAEQKRQGDTPRRHRADVTADRLADDLRRWNGLLSGSEHASASVVIHALREIANGVRN